MAVYNQVLLYTFRDTLASGDPNKVIKGAYLDGEFGAIHTASLDAASLSLTNNFSGTNSFNGANLTTTFAGKVIIGAPSSGIALTVNGVAGTNVFPVMVQGGAVAGQSNGIDIQAGVGSSADRLLDVLNTTGVTRYFGIFGDGHFALGQNGTTNTIIGSAAGNVTIAAPSSGNALAVTGVANFNAGVFTGSGTAGQSQGIAIQAGTNSSDYSLKVSNASATTNYFEVRGDGAILGGGPVAAAFVDMTPDSSTFTATLTGFTATVTATATWYRIGKFVTLRFPSTTSTSNANTMTLTGLPAAIQPATPNFSIPIPAFSVEDNGTPNATPQAIFTAASVITFQIGNSATGFTASGIKGTTTPLTLQYALF